jgi:Tfp pilus assembly protein PilF
LLSEPAKPDEPDHIAKLRAMEEEWNNGYKMIFPHVSPKFHMAPRAIKVIGSYAKQLGLAPLKRDHVRYFSQPWGIVGGGVDVDLITGRLFRYPGTHDGPEITDGMADSEGFSRLKYILNLDAFRNIPAEDMASGVDGCSEFIELDQNGVYSWKCHWGFKKSPILIEAIEILSGLANHPFPLVKPASLMASEVLPWIAKDARKMWMFRLRRDHVRLFVVSMGFVEWAVDLDLAAGSLTYGDQMSYMSDHCKGTVENEMLQPIKSMIETDVFRNLPSEDTLTNDDDFMCFIEVNLDGDYSWKYHSSNEPLIVEIKKQVELLSGYVQLKNAQESEAQTRRNIAKMPENGYIYSSLARSLQYQGRFEEAIEYYNQAAALQSEPNGAVWNIASVLQQQGKINEAVELYQRAIQIAPRNSDALYQIGTMLLTDGCEGEAMNYFERSLQMCSEHLKFHIKTANALLRKGKPQQAILFYEQILWVKQDYTPGRFNLGRALEQVGKMDKAMDQYHIALTLKPDFYRAERALNRIRSSQ